MDHTSFKYSDLVTEEGHESAVAVIMRRAFSVTALFLGLSTAIATPTNAANTSLRAQYPEMVRQSGKVLVFDPEDAVNAVTERWGRFVLYAPLNRLWLIDATGAVFEHAYIDVKHEPFEHLVLHWMHSLDEDIFDTLPAAAQFPAVQVESAAPHPLATAYDALLAKPLAQAFDPLPVGAYFNAGGHVFDASGAQIAEWNSYGPQIALRLIPVTTSADETKVETPTPDADPVLPPVWQWLAVADLKAALNPEPPQGDQ